MINPLQSNHQLWNAWTHLHVETESDYQPAISRFRAGEITLDVDEVREVGDVVGKSLLHLMCHLGLGTLSFARLGAIVTGLDFSEESIRAAQAFNHEAGLDARFICSNLYDFPAQLDEKFDIVYTSGGVLPWLPELKGWADIIAGCLKPGGIFYLKDSHPFRRVMFPLVVDAYGKIAEYHYFSDQPLCLEMRGSYAQPNTEEILPAYFWVHGIGEIVTALCSAGLRIEFLHEFPKIYSDFATYVPAQNGTFELRGVHDWAVPNQLSLRARLI